MTDSAIVLCKGELDVCASLEWNKGRISRYAKHFSQSVHICEVVLENTKKIQDVGIMLSLHHFLLPAHFASSKREMLVLFVQVKRKTGADHLSRFQHLVT